VGIGRNAIHRGITGEAMDGGGLWNSSAVDELSAQ